ncbi:hypothetical protein [Brevundimonas sp. NPDC058933]|uniref:hypothetical protein n=1 Tax=Brevundimonas sp. NPDC058933 TaxID=3346673 RepID=UPI003BEF2D94
MSFNFSVPSRVDNQLAETGVDLNITSNGINFGTFKVCYIDPYNPRDELKLKRIKQKYAGQLRRKELTEWDEIRITLVEANLLGWSGVKDGKGKEVPFSVEAAHAYFSMEQTRWIMLELARRASDVETFAPETDELENAEAIEKN